MKYVRRKWSGRMREIGGKSEGREMRCLEYYISRFMVLLYRQVQLEL